jgi:NAD(P)-dependent dehydrogenase (short-subunit alcohol dehydrogenase family)
MEKWGGLDVLVNNAALYGTLQRKPFAEIEEDVWDKVMAVNVKGVWQATRHLAPLMKASGGGSIINIASATVFSGSPQWMHYVASKGAVIAMSRTMAKELGDDKIRVNVLAPGFTMNEASLGLMENARTYGVDRGALKRPAEVEDIVGGALFLASPLSSYMTGQTMIIDGGRQFI